MHFVRICAFMFVSAHDMFFLVMPKQQVSRGRAALNRGREEVRRTRTPLIAFNIHI